MLARRRGGQPDPLHGLPRRGGRARGAVRSVGIDAEPHDVLPEGVLDAISLPAERTELAALPPVCTGTEFCSAPRKQRTKPGFR